MKKIFNIFIVIFALTVIITSCEDRPDPYQFPKDEYYYEIPDVPVTQDYVIGVPYDVKMRDSASQVWWNNTTKAHSLYTGTPILGEYDVKADEGMLRQQLEWGKEAGIDFFILSWGGHGYNDTILRNWEELWAQDNARPKVVIRFDPGYRFGAGKDTLQWNLPRMDSLRYDLDSVYTHVMLHDFAY
jgi:hypothetical protein